MLENDWRWCLCKCSSLDFMSVEQVTLFQIYFLLQTAYLGSNQLGCRHAELRCSPHNTHLIRLSHVCDADAGGRKLRWGEWGGYGGECTSTLHHCPLCTSPLALHPAPAFRRHSPVSHNERANGILRNWRLVCRRALSYRMSLEAPTHSRLVDRAAASNRKACAWSCISIPTMPYLHPSMQVAAPQPPLLQQLQAAAAMVAVCIFSLASSTLLFAYERTSLRPSMHRGSLSMSKDGCKTNASSKISADEGRYACYRRCRSSIISRSCGWWWILRW